MGCFLSSELSDHRIFLGQNGVMVLTHTLWRGYGHTVEFSDKQSFNLTSQSHQFALDAILCEKDEVFIDIFLLIPIDPY